MMLVVLGLAHYNNNNKSRKINLKRQNTTRVKLLLTHVVITMLLNGRPRGPDTLGMAKRETEEKYLLSYTIFTSIYSYNRFICV